MSIERAMDRARESAQAGNLPEAIAALRMALRRSTNHPVALRMLGMYLVEAAQFDQAIHHLGRVVALQPEAPEPMNNLANALASAGRHHEAVDSWRRALAIAPDFLPAWFGLSRSLVDVGDAIGALEAANRCDALRPGWTETGLNRVRALETIGRFDDADATLRGCMTADPSDPRLAGRRIALMVSRVAPDDEARAALDAYGRAIGPCSAPAPSDLDPARPLRVGLLSPDLRTHSVGYFVDAITRRVPTGFTLEAFSCSASLDSDPMTRTFRSRIRDWQDVHTMGDATLADCIRARRIDVLLDLAGHTAGNRLAMLRLRPAPLTVTAIGFPGSTGHPAIDVRLVDAVTDPPGSERRCTERLVRLDPCFLCYTPPPDAPEPAMPPATAPITFGSFNAATKISPETVGLWSRALAAVPGSRLLLKARAFVDPAACESLLHALAGDGIVRDRVELSPGTRSMREHLAMYGRMHVALDTFPYAGTTTTCEALWMGVPVVSVPGEGHASRVGASLLRAAGLDELVARDADDFVRIAARLATAAGRLAAFRFHARSRLSASDLMNAEAYSRRFYGALREAWVRRCMGP